MESGAKGCEVVVSGKLRGQRAKSMKFVDGLMIHSGEPTNHYVDTAIRHVYLRQGMFTLYAIYMYLRWYQTIYRSNDFPRISDDLKISMLWATISSLHKPVALGKLLFDLFHSYPTV